MLHSIHLPSANRLKDARVVSILTFGVKGKENSIVDFDLSSFDIDFLYFFLTSISIS